MSVVHDLSVREALDALDIERQDELDIFVVRVRCAVAINVGVLGSHLDTRDRNTIGQEWIFEGYTRFYNAPVCSSHARTSTGGPVCNLPSNTNLRSDRVFEWVCSRGFGLVKDRSFEAPPPLVAQKWSGREG